MDTARASAAADSESAGRDMNGTGRWETSEGGAIRTRANMRPHRPGAPGRPVGPRANASGRTPDLPRTGPTAVTARIRVCSPNRPQIGMGERFSSGTAGIASAGGGTQEGGGMKNTRMLFTAGVAALVGLWAIACHDGKTPATPEHVHATAVVSLNQSSVTLKAGEHATLMAQPTCSCGEVLPSAVTWTTSDPAVALVADGEVTAVSFGSATVTATADGKSATATVVVQPNGTVVGSLGGVVSSADGAVVLDIPAGALATATDITITAVDNAVFSGDTQFLPGTGYEIKPAGTTLNVPVTLRLGFNPANLPSGVFQEQLRLRERDRTQNQWR
ncbi:MAG: Ig-like domain-containing protein, partial [Gemmatimonadota bacterium]|nr:Ig-like domain-containing protein [Gemmatimonadota bacterium]